MCAATSRRRGSRCRRRPFCGEAGSWRAGGRASRRGARGPGGGAAGAGKGGERLLRASRGRAAPVGAPAAQAGGPAASPAEPSYTACLPARSPRGRHPGLFPAEPKTGSAFALGLRGAAARPYLPPSRRACGAAQGSAPCSPRGRPAAAGPGPVPVPGLGLGLPPRVALGPVAGGLGLLGPRWG